MIIRKIKSISQIKNLCYWLWFVFQELFGIKRQRLLISDTFYKFMHKIEKKVCKTTMCKWPLSSRR